MRSPSSWLMISFIMIVLPSSAFGSPPPVGAKTADFQRAVQERFAAGINGDPSFASYFVADAIYTVSSNTGNVAKAARYSKKDPTEKEWVTINDFNVIVRGDVAVATYDSIDHERFPTSSMDTPYRHTDTFQLREGQWLIVAIQADVEPRGRVAIDPNAWKAYVGDYRAGDGVTHTVRRDRNAFTDRETGDTHPYAMIPTSSSTFRVADDPADYMFIKDAKGIVMALLSVHSRLPTIYYRQR